MYCKWRRRQRRGVSNIHFAHSKVAATLHSLRQLPRRVNNSALSPLMRLHMCRSCVLTLALENLRYLRTKVQVHTWQVALSLYEAYVWSLRTTTVNVAGSGNSTADTPTNQVAVSVTLSIHLRIPLHSTGTTIRPQDQKQKLRPT